MRAFLVVTLLATLAAPALAQVQDARGKPVVVFDMDADVIEGSLHVPDVVVTPRGPKATHRNLIRIRQSFSQELLASASKI